MSKDSKIEPQAIPIMQVQKNGKYGLDLAAIMDLFRRSNIFDKPVCIVSIAGAFRKGKSLMLNFFLRYFRNKGYENSNWTGDEKSSLNEGIEWRGGRKACTLGILLWNEVFVVKKDGREVAVLLVDTQGLYDNKTDTKTNSVIFSLSTLMSCVQIFNLTAQIQENDLSFLQLFTEYAKTVEDASENRDSKPFQTLIFLIRDWQHAKELEYGFEGGREYLQEVIEEESENEELATVRKYLSDSFTDIKCCLMPHPGKQVAENFSGRLSDIESSFLDQTVAFVGGILKPENLVLKTLNGQVITGSILLQYLRQVNESLSSENLPTPKSMTENLAEMQNLQAKDHCSKLYTDIMEEALRLNTGNFVEESVLEKTHKAKLAHVLHEFEKLTKFGGEEKRKPHRENLRAKIDGEFITWKDRNKSKKTEAMSNSDKIYEELTEKYKRDIEQASSESSLLSTDEMEKLCSRFAAKVEDDMDKKIPLASKKTYSDKFRGAIERIRNDCKRENSQKLLIESLQKEVKIKEEKRKEAERKLAHENEEKRKEAERKLAQENKKRMRKLSLEMLVQELSDKYKRELQQVSGGHVDESFFLRESEALKIKTLKNFTERIRKLEPSSDLQFDKNEEEITLKKLQKALSDIFESRSQSVKEAKEILQRRLKANRNEAYVKYNEVMKKALEDDYVAENLLSKMHNKTVNKLMARLRSQIKGEPQCQMHADHLKLAETNLRKKWPQAKRWNNQNYSYWGAAFKVVTSPFWGPFAVLTSILDSIVD